MGGSSDWTWGDCRSVRSTHPYVFIVKPIHPYIYVMVRAIHPKQRQDAIATNGKMPSLPTARCHRHRRQDVVATFIPQYQIHAIIPELFEFAADAEVFVMLEMEVIFVIKENIYYRHLYTDLAESFSLPMIQEHLKPVRVLDRYFDTPDLKFLRKGSSFRVRERRFLTGQDSQGRLAIKTIHPDNEKTKLALLRDERRLVLEGWRLKRINEFFELFGEMLICQPMKSIIAVEELSEEIQLGDGPEHFHLSFDKVTYIDEANYNHHTEYILEVESHQYPVAILEDLGAYLMERWPLEHTKESKYLRGMRFLNLV